MDLSKIKPEEKLLYNAYNNLLVFGRAFLPGDFKKKPPAYYQQVIANEINSKSQKPCAIILPRGHIKTTMIKCSIVHDFCYHKKAMEYFAKIASTKELKEFWEEEARKRQPRFYAWVSKSQDDSVLNVEYVSDHLDYNPKLAHYFGFGSSLRGKTWNKEDIVTKYFDKLKSSSNLKSVRGKTKSTLEYGAVRFYKIFNDDFENEQNTKTYQSRKDLKRTLLASILPAIEVDQEGARMYVIGTPVHGDSFIQNILDDFEKIKDDPEAIEKYSWKVLTWKATQPNMPGGVLWEGGMPRKVLDRKKKELSERGEISLYYQEYELEVQSDEDRRWTRNHIKFWTGSYHRENDQNFLVEDAVKIPVSIYLGCDPATDIDTESADMNVVMAIAIDANTNVYVLEYESHRSIPVLSLREAGTNKILDKEGIVDIYVRLYNKYHADGGTIEDVAMTRSVFQSFNSERSRPGSFIYDRWDIQTRSEKPAGKGSKLSRIYGRLNGRFSAGKVHLRENMFELINQIVGFGSRMAHDDCIESLDLACLGAVPPEGQKQVIEEKRDRYTGLVIREPERPRAKSWQI